MTALMSAMSPWPARQADLNLADTARDRASFWSTPTYAWLRQIRAAVEPDDMIRSDHPGPSARVTGMPVRQARRRSASARCTDE